ncbi:MAG: penicillin acylase family protein [Acidimicrobiales bacterium]|nr:penicillin acylase family protein [Acidimicrobiales bacterium]
MVSIGERNYDVEIRRTTHGVAHIRANDWGSLGYGQGYGCAQDHLVTLADQYTKVRSERSLFHGAGPDGGLLATDFGYLAMGVMRKAPELRDSQPTHIRELVSGYVAGLNRYIKDAAGTEALAEWCRDAPWIREIDELDHWAYMIDLALMASGRNVAEIIGRAQAPGPDGPAPASPMSALSGTAPAASNGWAFGSDATASGHGIVVANPHFPWAGEARFWECHLTIPGELDVYGVSLLGTPGVQMGFNADVAWTHTFSRGNRFTLARLDLVDGDPTTYRFGEDTRAMNAQTYSVQVRGDNAEVTTEERTLWSSHHGPIVNLPLLGWGMDNAFAFQDANLDNHAMLAQFLGMATARSMDEFQASYAEIQGMPWVNTLAADRSGRAWFIDASTTPALSEGAKKRFVERLETDFVAALLHQNRVALLDGSNPDDDWISLEGARRDGLLPYGEMPQLERRDYVLNANDSHWLNHAESPLEGYSPLHGLERTPRSLRTRQNLLVAAALAASGTVTNETAIDALLDNKSLSAQLLVDAVIERVRNFDTETVELSESNRLAEAAEILAQWDQRFDLSSSGAVLWREFMAGFEPAAHQNAGALFAVAFDPDDPLNTPRDLAAAPHDVPDPVLVSLLKALDVLAEAGVDPSAPLGEAQWVQRGEHRIGVHGGYEADGVCNVLAPNGSLSSHSLEPSQPRLRAVADRAATSGLAEGGYRCTYGTSFLMSVELTDDGPEAVGLLAYGQCGDPRSPHHVDGTVAYANKATRPLLFTDEQIEKDPNLVRLNLRTS